MNVKAAIAAAFSALLEAKQYADGAVLPKADKADSLAGYGIQNAFTKEEVTQAISAAIADVVGLAPEHINTLKEVADKFTLTDDALASVLSILSSKAALTQVYERSVIDGKMDAKVSTDAFNMFVTQINAAFENVYTKTDFSDADLSALVA